MNRELYQVDRADAQDPAGVLPGWLALGRLRHRNLRRLLVDAPQQGGRVPRRRCASFSASARAWRPFASGAAAPAGPPWPSTKSTAAHRAHQPPGPAEVANRSTSACEHAAADHAGSRRRADALFGHVLHAGAVRRPRRLARLLHRQPDARDVHDGDADRHVHPCLRNRLHERRADRRLRRSPGAHSRRRAPAPSGPVLPVLRVHVALLLFDAGAGAGRQYFPGLHLLGAGRASAVTF